ncbi:MAG: metallophosphoesterase family protein [Phyllobacterium sp.]
MTQTKPPKIAIIADAHLHDLYGDYDFYGFKVDGRPMSARTLKDTALSTRVFNESYYAFRYALDEVARRGIRHVVLVGDYSDDGQVSTVAAVRELLDQYAHEHGMAFFATVGNHDIYGPHGRHQSKRFLNRDGSSAYVTSDPWATDATSESIIVSEKMYCRGYPDGLDAVADTGFFHRNDYLYWETPFGKDDAAASRLYEVVSADGQTRRTLMDASYLVEPFDGIWLLMIDANVFVPKNGDLPVEEETSFIDSTGAGWNGMIRHKRFILQWAAEVAKRAEMLGKQLLVFSHYPILDPLDGTLNDELAILGPTSFAQRTPDLEVAKAAADAGINIHFSGHLHVNDTARFHDGSNYVVNVGVPSLVAFPPAFKIVDLEAGCLNIETVSIGNMPLSADIMDAYRAEAGEGGEFGELLQTSNYGHFLHEHINQMIVNRYLPKEWPQDLAEIVSDLSIGDLLLMATVAESMPATTALERLRQLRADRKAFSVLRTIGTAHRVDVEKAFGIPLLDLLGDWYRLRKASELALDWISPERLLLYECLIAVFSEAQPFAESSVQTRFAGLIRMLKRYLSGLPSRHFTIDLRTGGISAN